MSEVKRVVITLAQPKPPNFAGKIAEGHYKVEDDTVMLCDKDGIPTDRYRLIRKLKPGNDARGIACSLLRERYSSGSPGNFSGPLHYRKLGF